MDINFFNDVLSDWLITIFIGFHGLIFKWWIIDIIKSTFQANYDLEDISIFLDFGFGLYFFEKELFDSRSIDK